MTYLTVLFFIGSIAMLWASSELVIRKIGPIARFFGVKELVVTILGVSVFSSLPELTVSAVAISQGNSELSIGNVIGSNFVTLTFVTALCAFIKPIEILPEVRNRESSWMILTSAVVMVLSLDGRLSRFDGLLLILLYIPYMISVLKSAKGHVAEAVDEKDKQPGKLMINIALALVGVGGIVFGAQLAVENGQIIGTAVGIPPLALGVILFAFGTSLPELAISLSATFKGKADVTIGEVYASNIFTQLVVLGVCCLISPIAVGGAILGFAMPFLILAAVLIQIFVTSGLRLNRLEAMVLLSMYLIFAVTSFYPVPSLDALVGW